MKKYPTKFRFNSQMNLFWKKKNEPEKREDKFNAFNNNGVLYSSSYHANQFKKWTTHIGIDLSFSIEKFLCALIWSHISILNFLKDLQGCSWKKLNMQFCSEYRCRSWDGFIRKYSLFNFKKIQSSETWRKIIPVSLSFHNLIIIISVFQCHSQARYSNEIYKNHVRRCFIIPSIINETQELEGDKH